MLLLVTRDELLGMGGFVTTGLDEPMAVLVRRIRTPLGLLAVTITLSGVLSAFLINDIVCLTLTPLILNLARRLR